MSFRKINTKKPVRYPKRGFLEVKPEHKKIKDVETRPPVRSDYESAGYDFYSKETVEIQPNEQYLFWTDVKAYMLSDESLSIHVRSSIGIKTGLTLANTTGIIDGSYFENEDNDGNIGICLRNNSDKIVLIEKDSRIAQGIFSKYLTIDYDLPTSKFRVGGIGSSGK